MAKGHIALLEDLATHRLRNPRDWSVFREKFFLAYPSFLRLILTQGYRFTLSEERLLALEKLNLTPTHMAALLGISKESVYTARYRLRKKLKLPYHKCIIDFLEGEEVSQKIVKK
ncbi:hypothetical protein WIW50_19690 [Flavobacteriaceae bacterium 3-367]|uniref:helix-turn-helix transcriptional regulator n=1 Tax=Eudoraea algarum TaxID=3417568 RepID=UPI003283B5D1